MAFICGNWFKGFLSVVIMGLVNLVKLHLMTNLFQISRLINEYPTNKRPSLKITVKYFIHSFSINYRSNGIEISELEIGFHFWMPCLSLINHMTLYNIKKILLSFMNIKFKYIYLLFCHYLSSNLFIYYYLCIEYQLLVFILFLRLIAFEENRKEKWADEKTAVYLLHHYR